MVTKDGRVLLLDFGLAASAATTPLTRTGSELGSLPYMAPEQLRADPSAVTQRTDVYGLGVTLYELLALRPAYLHASSSETRSRILVGDAVPLRVLQPSIPWDAETVCLTAMDREEQRRYPTMQAFADDLQNYLARRAIQARRPGLILRTRRMVERHPVRTVLALSACALILAVPSTLTFQAMRSEASIRESLNEANTQADRARAGLRDALAAIESMLVSVAETKLERHSRMDETRRQLLRDALALYERIRSRESSDPKIVRDLARSRFRIGQIYLELGDLDSSRRELERARDELTAILANTPSDCDDWYVLANTFGLLGDLDRRAANLEASDRAVGEAVHILERWENAPPPDQRKWRGDLASMVQGLALNHMLRREPEPAFAKYDRALRILTELLDEAPDDATLAQQQYIASFNLGSMYLERNDLDQAESRYREGLAVNLRAGELTRDHPDVLADRITVHQALAIIAERRKDERTWRTQAECGVALGERMVANFPDRDHYRAALQSVRSTHARALEAMGAFDRARDVLDVAIDELNALREEGALKVAVLGSLRQAYTDSKAFLERQGDLEGALAQADLSLAIVDEMCRATPDSANGRVLMFEGRAERARILFRLERFDDASRECAAAIEALERHAGAPVGAEQRFFLMRVLSMQACSLVRAGDREHARGVFVENATRHGLNRQTFSNHAAYLFRSIDAAARAYLLEGLAE